MSGIENPQYWDERYQSGDTPWDLLMPAPALADWLKTHPGNGQRAFVPGCGRGHDPAALARAGYVVTAVDIAALAVAEAKQTAAAAGLQVDVRQADLFDLPTEWDAQFDLVFEHTCFCAIDPSLRAPYVNAVARLLKPGGRYLAVFYTHGEPGGPPFDVRPEEIRRLFAPHFELDRLEPSTVSVEDRAGDETLGEFTRRPTP